ncbi:TonB-dependent siderophore receptor [Cupriavidus pauculus]|uniref:TonB-dependent siderophore receptor n=1 Tax=Cupriavidus pauculus TaxID=82633 RepID=UPI001D0C2958|nr:TonB-dependent siderophore receptor [Cupriavidus pauculus]
MAVIRSRFSEQPTHRAVRLAVLAMSLAAATLPPLARADSAVQADASARQAFDVAPGPLGRTLSSVAARSGIALSFDPALTEGLASPGVSGRYTPREALEKLLAGSGLSLVERRDGSLMLTPGGGTRGAAEADNHRLPAVTVTAAGAESGRSAVVGYVARESATANKSDTSLMATSQSVSVITRDQMSDQAVQSVSDALKYTAGVNADPYGADPRADWFYIRGFNADVYWDGLRVPQIANRAGSYAAFRVDPSSVERVEVLRGPSSVLYGAGNLGGFVNLISKDPQAEPYRELALDYGSHNRRQARFDFTGPLNDDGTLLYRVNGLGRLSDTQTYNVTDNRVNINPSLTWRPNGTTSLTLSATYLYDDMGSSASYGPALGMVTPSRFGKIPPSLLTGDPSFDKYRKTQAAVGYRLEHRFTDQVVFRQNVRYTHLDLDYKSLFGRSLAADQRTLNRTAYQAQPNLNGVQVDNNVQVDVATGPVSHKIVTGVDLQWQDFHNRVWSINGPSLDLYAPVYGLNPALPVNATTSTDQQQKQLGLYLQDQLRWGHWVLSLAGRQDYTRSSTRNNRTGVTTDQDPSKFTWRTGLLYEAPIGLSPYVSYSTSFLPTLSTNLAGDPLKPTTGQQVEAGVKYQPPGSRSIFTVSAFNLTQQNVSTTDPANTANTIQTGEIRSRGVELEARTSLMSRLNLVASFTYQDPVVTRSNGADLGKRPYGVPRTMASAWADYTLPPLHDVRLGFGGGVRYIGNTAGDAANTFDVSSVVLFDASVHADFASRWRLQINAANLFDREYVAGCNSTIQCYYGNGRTVIATLSTRW